MNKNINQLLDKEVSRKEFLQFIAGGVMLAFGVTNFISYISQFNRTTTPRTEVDGHRGFGSSRFGV